MYKLIPYFLITVVFAGGVYYFTQSSTQELAVGAPDKTTTRDLEPFADSTYEIGSSTGNAYLRVTTDEICLTGATCYTSLSGGGGGDSTLWVWNSNDNDIDSDGASTTATTSVTTYFVTTDSTEDASTFPYASTTGLTTTNFDCPGCISEAELNLNAPTNNYILVASSSAPGGFEWVATSSSFLNLGTGGGGTTYTAGNQIIIDGTVISADIATSTALAANGGNCSAGSFPLGVDASGAAESCTDAWTEAENTAAAYLQNVVEDTTPQLGGSLDAQGNNITDLGDVTFKTGATGGTLRTGTSNADKFELQAYDVNDTVYRKVLEVDAGNTPTLEVFADSFAIWDNTDETKQLFFTLSGGTTGVTTEMIYSPTSNRQITFPDNSGTLAFVSDISSTTTLPNLTVTESQISDLSHYVNADASAYLYGSTTRSDLYTAGNALTWTGTTLDFDGGASPGGELGGTWASPTIDDSLAVTNWNLTTPTFTTNFTFDGTTVTGLSGADTTVITGTAGTNGNCVQWNADGDIVDAGAACGTGSGGGGSLSTTTEKIGAGTSGTVSYVTDEFMLGGSATPTAEFLFDYASSALQIQGGGNATSSLLSSGAEQAVILGEADQNDDYGWDLVTGIEWVFKSTTAILRGAGTSAVTAITTALNWTFTGTVDLTGATVNLGGGAIDAITEIASGLRSGEDTTFITGTAGTNGNIVSWNGDGDAVDGGLAVANIYDTGDGNLNDDDLSNDSINALSDVNTTGVASGTVLAYDGGSTSWVPRATSTFGFGLIVGQVWTGNHDFGGATFLEIPNGTGPTADDPGELAHDTTDNQLILDDRVIRTSEEIFKVKIGSTTPLVAGSTTTWPVLFDGYTVTDIACYVEGGTSKIINTFGESITCGTSVTQDDGTITSGTVTALATSSLGLGTDSGSWNWLNITVYGTYTRE